jgi:hypothetical protein
VSPEEKEFWVQLEAVGREVLEQGKAMGFGMSLVEVKFQRGTPSVLIRSISVNTRYPDDDAAKTAIAQELEEATQVGFDGARTFTVVYNKGKINRILLDEYHNRLLK